MINLTTTTDKLQLVTSAAAAIKCHASWADNLAGAISQGKSLPASIATATTTDIVSPPTASTCRNIRYISIFNDHGSTTCVVTAQITDGTNTSPLAGGKATLLAGESLVYVEGAGWTHFDTDGIPKTGTPQVTTLSIASDSTVSSTTPAAVTALTKALAVGAYIFEYFVCYQTAATTTGIKLSVNFTGTVTQFAANLEFGAGTTASSDAPDQDMVAAGAQVLSMFAARAKSTAGWGVTLSVDTANSDMLSLIRGVMVVTVAGNIELYQGSEVAASNTVLKASATCLRLTKVA